MLKTHPLYCLTIRISGAAPSTKSTMRNSLRGLRYMRWLDDFVRQRVFTCKHHGDVLCVVPLSSVAYRQFRRSLDNRQLLSAILLVRSVSCSLVVLGLVKVSVQTLLYVHILASAVELALFERAGEPVCRSSLLLTFYFFQGLIERDDFII